MTTTNYHKLTIQVPAQEMVKKLQEIAAQLGYIQTRGGSKGTGSISQLMEAIARGEVRVIK